MQHVQVMCQNTASTIAMCPSFNEGAIITVIADRIYFINGLSSLLDDKRPVVGGVGVCHGSDQLWIICRNMYQSVKLSMGLFSERLDFLSADRTDTTEISKGAVKFLRDKVGNNSSEQQYTASLISPTDEITAVTCDVQGKKIFAGSIEGHVYLFDGYTFGLLKRLTTPVCIQYSL